MVDNTDRMNLRKADEVHPRILKAFPTLDQNFSKDLKIPNTLKSFQVEIEGI